MDVEIQFHCTRCGYEREYNVAPMVAPVCPVCGLGTLVAGQAQHGFGVNIGQLVPRNIVRPPYQPVHSGQTQVWQNLNYFIGVVGTEYLRFIRAKSCFVGRFATIKVPDVDRFAWLSPYTGNMHNRMHFTQMLLASVARAKFTANGGVFPRLIEPFLGSGQVFLNACAWGPALNDGVPLFHEFIGGDLNPYLLAAWKFIADYGDSAAGDYLLSADSMDQHLPGEFANVVQLLNNHGHERLANTENPGELHEAAMMYMWLVNRCLHGTSLNGQGGVNATFNAGVNLVSVRQREGRTIAAVLAMMRTVSLECTLQDFAVTCSVARPGDIVFMDCPFPKFSNLVPTVALTRPQEYNSQTANTYGTGDDGAGLQTRIVTEARRLTAQGTTVILCNFANPGLILAYHDLLPATMSAAVKRTFCYTYRSPTTQSEAYQLVILPGHGVDFAALPDRINNRWLLAGGDNLVTGEYFNPVHVDTDMGEDPSKDDSSDEDYVDQ